MFKDLPTSPLAQTLLNRAMAQPSRPSMTPTMPRMGSTGRGASQPTIKPLATKLRAPKH